VFSTIDGSNQPCLFIKANAFGKRPLLVLLHTWSSTYRDFAHMLEWQEQAKARNWHCLQPNFRGPNNNPEACASLKARQDILDAVDFVVKNYSVDNTRIYLAGVSGGGHMALTMAAHAPTRWAAVTAWCPIADLAAWHAECSSAGLKYAGDIEKSCGGPPGASPDSDNQYLFRSPIHHLARAAAVPLDINAGIHDGHSGSVPIHHAIDAFNVIASALGETPVPKALIAQLSARNTAGITQQRDATYGRPIYCRAQAGASRLSIFEGVHEGIPAAASVWLAQFPQ
jgi:pimeloyl-ACP methyl ester carboxylesterase